MSDTPLSDLISAMRADSDERVVEEFRKLFLTSRLGVMAVDFPRNRQPGETFQTGPNDRVTIQIVDTPDGRCMVKACADPHVFAKRYPSAYIMAEMVGRHLLEMVLKAPELDGVLVCSAASFHSAPIGRDDAARLLGVRDIRAATDRPWWKFWDS